MDVRNSMPSIVRVKTIRVISLIRLIQANFMKSVNICDMLQIDTKYLHKFQFSELWICIEFDWGHENHLVFPGWNSVKFLNKNPSNNNNYYFDEIQNVILSWYFDLRYEIIIEHFGIQRKHHRSVSFVTQITQFILSTQIKKLNLFCTFSVLKTFEWNGHSYRTGYLCPKWFIILSHNFIIVLLIKS